MEEHITAESYVLKKLRAIREDAGLTQDERMQKLELALKKYCRYKQIILERKRKKEEEEAEKHPKYLLFDRRKIVKYANRKVYLRDPVAHTWTYDDNFTCYYLYDDLFHVEEIDYDEENEEILALRRAEGTWACEDVIERCHPCPQVTAFLEKTGITYEDLYGPSGQGAEELFASFPDLLEGAPGARQ